ncbi:AP-1 complex subunit mu-2-like [Cucumis melo var. makuwa]|uniref:AP-1 complex subunit mu-2-like n=1 Tax=Cucumis melo var. makuwa TaxID=1194695 RepID=A0A5A7T6D2_CUCMM|nr:AP-1 complex subunit mu-2-like [Cucumis melo var. makuwa]
MDMDEMTYSTILLYLSDEVVRLVDEATTTGELWKKLESLYLTKSLPDKLYLKEKFFGYKMDQSKGLEENLDEFQKIVVDLTNIGEKMSNENQTSKEASSSKHAAETSEANVTDGYDSVEKSDGRKLLLGDNGVCDVKGTGSVQIATHDGMIIMLANVRYVPELKRNLISLGELDRSGYTIKFGNGVMKVTKGSLVKLRGALRNDLYVLEGTVVLSSAAMTL